MPNNKLELSVVVTCYKKPELLKLALKTLIDQTIPPREIIVADDGSGEENFEVSREIRAATSIPIVHVWQPDEGFRLNRSRNNAIANATGEYIVMLDGDCFVNKYFVEDHISAARYERFVAGTRVHVDPERRDYIIRTGDTRVTFFTPRTTKKQYAIRSKALSSLLSKDGTPYSSYADAIGANLGFWTADAERVNGFNEVFVGYGDDDVEFCNRLSYSGVVRYKMRHLGMAYHFKHSDRNRIVREDFERKLAESVEENRYRVRDGFGLDRAQKDSSLRIER